MELSSGGQAPCSTEFPCYVSILGNQLYQSASRHCCEKLCSASVNFFLRPNVLVHSIVGDLGAHLPTMH